ncbi:hypothetical protein N7456_006718 [Penicillium angulare]|uniref:2EXR domain-containing protein n=1 Tax=Penicillium angulare TaxID=116970 RepID=A0A9W9KCG7_9EURO|nr:hypothetical protein N7456_006718 [Penicillium angulare]
MADEKSFHFFPMLPTELRIEIWRLCLPYRIWEIDRPSAGGIRLETIAGSDDLFPCTVSATVRTNGLPPVLTRVCRESRYIACKSGGILPADFFDDLPGDEISISWVLDELTPDVWIDPIRDAAHINWSLPVHYGPELAYFDLGNRKVANPPSMMDNWFEWHPIPDEERYDVLDDLPRWSVIMRVIIIHASFREATQTGLFGLLGDATIQVISSSDEKVNALYDFAKGCSCENLPRASSQVLKKELETKVKEAGTGYERWLPKMQPAIMFRLCTSLKCYGSSRRTEASRECEEDRDI